MLMEKADLGNIRSLLKIRNKECTGIRYIYYLLIFLFMMDLLGIIKSVFTFRSEAVSIMAQPYSNWSFALTVIACIYYTVNYRDYSHRHQIYPQSSKNTFIAYSVFCHITFAKMQAAALVLYLLQYGFCAVLDIIKRNVDYAYPINLFFLTSGTLITFLYGFMVLSLIILLGALDRKFTWWFRITFVGILAILVVSAHVNWLFDAFGFVVKEYSLVPFLLKAFFTVLLLILLGFGINIITRQYKQKREFRIYHAAAIVVMLFVVFIDVRFFAPVKTISYIAGESYDMTEDILEGAKYQVDVSELPEGSQLKVMMSGIIYEKNQISFAGMQTKYDDKLLINYQPPNNMINDVNLSTYTKPDLSMTLKNNTLTINITALENRKVVMLYPFSFFQEFTSYAGNHFYKKGPLSTYTSGGNGVIWLFPPEAKNLTIITH